MKHQWIVPYCLVCGAEMKNGGEGECMTDAEVNTILAENNIDPGTLVDELQDRMQRKVAFDENLSDQERDNLRWAINDIERDREERLFIGD